MMYMLLIRILLDIRMTLYGVAVWSILAMVVVCITNPDINTSIYIDSYTSAFYNYLKIFVFPLGDLIHSISLHFSESVYIGISFIYFFVGCWQWFVLVPYLIRVLPPKLKSNESVMKTTSSIVPIRPVYYAPWFTIKALWIGVPVLAFFLFLNEMFISDTGNYRDFMDIAIIVSFPFSYPSGHPFGVVILDAYNFYIAREHMQSVSYYYFQDSSIAYNIIQWIVMFLAGYIQWFILIPYFTHKSYRYYKRLQPLQVAHHALQWLCAKLRHRCRNR